MQMRASYAVHYSCAGMQTVANPAPWWELPSPGIFSTLVASLAPPSSFFFLASHIERLQRDAAAFQIPSALVDSALLRCLLKKFLRDHLAGEQGTMKLRILVSQEGTTFFAEPYQNPWEKRSICLQPVQIEREFPEYKTTRIEASKIARERAVRESADEALLTDGTGIAREGAWSSLFWFDRSGALCTTGSRVLHGVTRAFLMAQHTVQLHELSLLELIRRASEIFVTQSTTGITPVHAIGGTSIGDGSIGARTLHMKRWYMECEQQGREVL